MPAGAGRSRSSPELFGALVERQMRLRGRRSWFGLGWPVLAPFFLLWLYAFVFHSVLRVPIDDYAVYLASGLLPWTFLAQTLGQGISSLSGEPELIRRAPFRHELLPMASVAVMAALFLVTLGLFVAYLGLSHRLAFALLPLLALPLVALVLFVTSVALVLSLIDVYNRDLRQVLGNLLTIWFFLVPIVYGHGMVRGRLRVLRSIDPMNLIVGQFRDILYWRRLSSAPHLVLVLALCVGCFAVTLTVFRRLAVELPKDV